MDSPIYITEKARSTITLHKADSPVNGVASYLCINGNAEKSSIYRAIESSIRLFHETFHRLTFRKQEAETELPATYKLHINEKNFSSYSDPNEKIWEWLQEEDIQGFISPKPLTYNTYLVKIPNNKYWFFISSLHTGNDSNNRADERLYHLLTQLLSSPKLKAEGVDLLLPDERVLVNKWSKSSVDFPAKKTIIDQFEESVQKHPSAIAVVAADATLTYAQLNEQANQLAHYLQGHGLASESLVPICMPRSSKMMVAILGILKAGAVYVPIDPGYPSERIEYILKDTAATFVIGSIPNKANPLPVGLSVIDLDNDWSSIGQQATDNLPRAADPSSLAYIIYTSGTTGRPKGVMIEHRALMDHCYGVIKAAGLGECRSFALFSPLVFDAGHSIIHSAFILGAAMHVLSSELIADGNKLSKYFKNNTIDCLKIVPSLWLSYALEDDCILAGKVMIFGGESFSAIIADKLRSQHYNGNVYNHYGPTETTIGKSIYQLDLLEVPTVVPIGRPFSNTRFYVVDEHGRRVPPGVPGELCIAGEGLARGYLNQPETTARFFVTDTFSRLRGKRMYRTGDVVKWLADGNVEYLGRKDEQVKINGHRIELSEIETVLNECPLVRQSIVLCRKSNLSGNRLEAFIVTNFHSQLKGIRQFMEDRLPDYMVPVTWHLLENFPLTINGKIDKRALEQRFAEIPDGLVYAGPVNKLQGKLVEIWKRLFERDKISINENFIEIGGNSLLAMRMVAAITKEAQIEASIAAIFKHPSIELLSAYLQFFVPLQGLPVLQKETKPAKIPLSFSQESLWFIHQTSGSVQYHLPFTYTIKGPVNKQALNDTFKAILNCHEVLRTVIYEEDGRGYQVVQPASEWQLQLVDGSILTEHSLKDFIKDFINKPFDLTHDVMLRAVLVSYNDDQHELVYVIHHIASDGWSSSIFYNELIKSYSSIIGNSKPFTDELPIQFSDFSLWQSQVANTGFWQEQLAYWKNNLSGVTPLQLPTDFRRPVVQISVGAKVESTISNEIYNGLQVISKQHGATMFMTVASALNALLHRYTNQDDICIGTPTAGRNQQQLEGLMGYFINTLALRNEVAGDLTFIELLQKVTETTIQAFNNQDVPFEKVVEVAVQQRDASRSPLFQVMLVLQNNKAKTTGTFGKAVIESSPTARDLHGTSIFDATFEITESSDGLQVSIEYATSLFKQETAERMLLHFTNLLQAIVLNPRRRIGEYNLLSEAEKHKLLAAFKAGDESQFTNENILELFEQQVAAYPNNIAAKFEEEEISYSQLAERSDDLAIHLNNIGINKKLVPIFMDHCIDMVISILAVMKAGGAYVPIDTEYPKERIRFIIEDTNATVLLCTKESRLLIDDCNVRIINVNEDPYTTSLKDTLPKIQLEDIAYVIYTSGSTGQPKGTLITHRGLAASSFSRKELYGNTGSVLLIPSYAFDSSVGVIFGAFVSGGTLVLCRHQDIKEPTTIKGLIPHTDTLLCVPSYYRFLLDEGIVQNSSISTVIVAGENLDAQLVNKHFSETNNCKLFNEYGPTEGTVWATVAEIEPGKKITIGKPIKTAQVYILNNNLQLVPEGITGELCIGGPQVAQGYLHLPEITNEKFVDSPFAENGNQKMYRTGDLARWLPDGQIEYLGRIDDQLKIRGHRIEPAGIEQILSECKAIQQAVIVARPGKDGNNLLVAYVNPEGDFDPAVYSRFLKDRLPHFMIPDTWAQVKEFALTPNGKIDKKALPEIESIDTKAVQYIKPATATEQALADIWQQLLPAEQISIHGNFFSLGGHSLLAMRLVSAIQKNLEVTISINELFLYSTIAELANCIDNKLANPSNPAKGFKYLVPVKQGGDKMPLYIIAGGGSTAMRFKSFSEMLDAEQPVYVFQSPFDDEQLIGFPSTITDIAAAFLNELLIQNPTGPFALSGHCIGGIIAFEMARQLQAAGKKVQSLILFDTVLQEEQQLLNQHTALQKTTSIIGKLLSQVKLKTQFEFFLLTKHPRSFVDYRITALKKTLTGKTASTKNKLGENDPTLKVFEKAEDIYAKAREQYVLPAYNGSISLFVANERYYFIDMAKDIKFKKMSATNYSNKLWAAHCTQLNLIETNGTHSDMFNKAHGPHFSKKLQEILDATSKQEDGK